MKTYMLFFCLFLFFKCSRAEEEDTAGFEELKNLKMSDFDKDMESPSEEQSKETNDKKFVKPKQDKAESGPTKVLILSDQEDNMDEQIADENNTDLNDQTTTEQGSDQDVSENEDEADFDTEATTEQDSNEEDTLDLDGYDILEREIEPQILQHQAMDDDLRESVDEETQSKGGGDQSNNPKVKIITHSNKNTENVNKNDDDFLLIDSPKALVKPKQKLKINIKPGASKKDETDPRSFLAQSMEKTHLVSSKSDKRRVILLPEKAKPISILDEKKKGVLIVRPIPAGNSQKGQISIEHTSQGQKKINEKQTNISPKRLASPVYTGHSHSQSYGHTSVHGNGMDFELFEHDPMLGHLNDQIEYALGPELKHHLEITTKGMGMPPSEICGIETDSPCTYRVESTNSTAETRRLNFQAEMIIITKERSDSKCEKDKTYGFNFNQTHTEIWVKDGCKGEFMVTPESGMCLGPFREPAKQRQNKYTYRVPKMKTIETDVTAAKWFGKENSNKQFDFENVNYIWKGSPKVCKTKCPKICTRFCPRKCRKHCQKKYRKRCHKKCKKHCKRKCRKNKCRKHCPRKCHGPKKCKKRCKKCKKYCKHRCTKKCHKCPKKCRKPCHKKCHKYCHKECPICLYVENVENVVINNLSLMKCSILVINSKNVRFENLHVATCAGNALRISKSTEIKINYGDLLSTQPSKHHVDLATHLVRAKGRSTVFIMNTQLFGSSCHTDCIRVDSKSMVDLQMNGLYECGCALVGDRCRYDQKAVVKSSGNYYRWIKVRKCKRQPHALKFITDGTDTSSDVMKERKVQHLTCAKRCKKSYCHKW